MSQLNKHQVDPATPSAARWDALRDTLPDPIYAQNNAAHTLDNHARDFSLFDARDGDAVRRQRALQKRRTRGAAPRPAWPARVLRALLTRPAMSLRSLASRLQRGPW